MDTESPLVEIGALLKAAGYSFITPTPLSHARVNRRAGNRLARSFRDVFGWSRPFEPALLPTPVLGAMSRAGVLIEEGALRRSGVRFSSIGDDLFVHSAFPTTAAESVFFGPDTYRFARLLRQAVRALPAGTARRAVDIGCGSGAGGIVVARILDGHDLHLDLVDVNEIALSFARANLALAGLRNAETVRSDVLSGVTGGYDLIVANPPYLNDPERRVYRHGGGIHGEALSIRIVQEALPRLNAGGWLVLYTGVAIVDGVDPLREFVTTIDRPEFTFAYDEIDPDVFGEELETAAYAGADRIAAVSLIAHRLA